MSKDVSRKRQYAAMIDYFAAHKSAANIIVDVGADQWKNSNSWSLIRDGWRGVLVEPVPRKASALAKQFIGDYVVKAVAISDYVGKGKLFMSKGDGNHSLLADWLPARHTGKLLSVNVMTLPVLLADCDVPHRFGVLDVDTEGNDPKVIVPMLATTAWRPDVIIVELIDNVLYLALLAAGYKFHCKFGIDSMWIYQAR